MPLEIKPGWTRYQSRKIVEAIAVDKVEAEPKNGQRYVIFADGSYTLVDESVFARGEPQEGDLLVRYSDGYISWSPRKAFEEGYENLPDA